MEIFLFPNPERLRGPRPARAGSARIGRQPPLPAEGGDGRGLAPRSREGGTWRARELPGRRGPSLPSGPGCRHLFYWARGGRCAVNRSDSGRPRCEGGDRTFTRDQTARARPRSCKHVERSTKQSGAAGRGWGGRMVKCKSAQLEAMNPGPPD